MNRWKGKFQSQDCVTESAVGGECWRQGGRRLITIANMSIAQEFEAQQ